MKSPGWLSGACFTALVVAAQSVSLRSTSTKTSTIHNVVESEWIRVSGVYCSDNWNLDHAIKAKDHKATDAKECRKSCQADKSCIGYSVTNENWGDRKPWCHLCKEAATQSHQNFDTYWGYGAAEKIAVVAKLAESKEHATHKQLQEIKDIEYDMCRSPEKVEAAELTKVQGKKALQSQLKDQKEEMRRHEEYQTQKLDYDIKRIEEAIAEREKQMAAYEGDNSASLESSLKTMKEKLGSLQQQREKHYTDTTHILEDEERSLEADIARIKLLESQLAKEKERKRDMLDKVRARLKEVGDKQDQNFWEEWLAMD